ncbi:MAG: hypothetical protein LBJ80_00285 [Rickettsiales bacterium]|jgi:hypothetical protein|nr:hypothetical protein [Rickettsiales bacterium]MDR1260852.1 hypothetical protein [Rickettsiales bacterium]
MKGVSALGYQVVISEETVERIASYKADLIDGKATARKYLGEKISGLDLSNISTYEFIELLLSTKKPQIFAEEVVKCDGTDWSSREFAILGDINVAVKALAYDNGVWNGKISTKYDRPLDVELLFTPGAMLSTKKTGVENNPDYQEVVENGKISQEKYNALVERRLLPLLSYVNSQAEKEKKAFVVLPGIGCGCFAGKFQGQMENKLDEALRAIIKKYKFPNIKGIHLGLHENRLNIEKKGINGVTYEVRGNGLPQLSCPQEYNEEFKDCKLYKVVAWDHVSLPGNDFFKGSRHTDDGVSAAATNSMEVITGVKGTYREGKYFPPEGYKDWEAVAKSNNVKLVANKENVKIVSRDGRYLENQELESKLNACHSGYGIGEQKSGRCSNNGHVLQKDDSSKKGTQLDIVASALAIVGVISGIAIAVYLEMLVVGIAVGTCCLVAAVITYCCNRPSNSLENSNIVGPDNYKTP